MAAAELNLYINGEPKLLGKFDSTWAAAPFARKALAPFGEAVQRNTPHFGVGVTIARWGVDGRSDVGVWLEEDA